MKNYDWIQHVRGESLFVDDLILPEGTLYASVFSSPIAHGKITSLDLDEAIKANGVIEILNAQDIPGENQIGAIIPDEKLLADEIVDFRGQPIALVIAKDNFSAYQAVKKIKMAYEEFPAITDPREAYQRGHLIIPPQIFSLGDTYSAWKNCDVIVEGTTESGGQEHVYLETQGSFAFPVEGGGVKIISSTQSPTAVQRAAARILGLAMNKIEVDVLRLGGAFGGKEDLSTAILDRALFHCTNSYFIPNVKATALCCRTNLPPNTAFRGFGGPQGMFVIEGAIYKAAEKMNIDPSIIQEKNLLNESDEFPYGQRTKYCMARPAWQKAIEKYNVVEIKPRVDQFNKENNLLKKGFALMPICFGISFTNTMLNQANALVHVYTDGRISISSAAI